MGSYKNQYRRALLDIAEKRGGVDSLILRGAEQYVESEEGLRVALGAIGLRAEDSLIAACEDPDAEFGA